MSNFPLRFGPPQAVEESVASRALRGGRSRVYVWSIPRLFIQTTHRIPVLRKVFKSPRARCPRNPQAGPPMLYSLAARPSCPSVAALRSNELRASTWSGLPTRAGSHHAPPEGGFPQPPAARLPRASRPLRAADAQNPPRAQHIATVPVAKLPAQRLCEYQAAQPRQVKARLDPPTSDPAPNLTPPHPARFSG